MGRALERRYPNGIVGVDSPMHPETRLYRKQRAMLESRFEQRATHTEGRFAHLAAQTHSDAALPSWNTSTLEVSPCLHSSGKRKADPERFMDMHSRLFPVREPFWEPERAAALRSHDVRGKRPATASSVASVRSCGSLRLVPRD